MLGPTASADDAVWSGFLRLVYPLRELPPLALASLCFLSHPLPASLGSARVTSFHRYYGRSDSWPGGSSAGFPGMNTTLARTRSLRFMYQTFRPFRLQPPVGSADRFDTLPISVRGLPGLAAKLWASPHGRGLASTTGRIEFTCVSDWPFTSSCSPPGLAATQLLSVTGRRTFARRGLAPL